MTGFAAARAGGETLAVGGAFMRPAVGTTPCGCPHRVLIPPSFRRRPESGVLIVFPSKRGVPEPWGGPGEAPSLRNHKTRVPAKRRAGRMNASPTKEKSPPARRGRNPRMDWPGTPVCRRAPRSRIPAFAGMTGFAAARGGGEILAVGGAFLRPAAGTTPVVVRTASSFRRHSGEGRNPGFDCLPFKTGGSRIVGRPRGGAAPAKS